MIRLLNASDSFNVEHIKKHSLSVAEIENALQDSHLKSFTTYKERMMILGRSQGRLLTIVLAKESDNKFYVITARDMDKRERLFYRRTEDE